MKLYEYKAYELSDMLKKNQISSCELVKEQFERIEEAEPSVSAYLTLNKDAAIADACEIDKKRASGEELSRLAGIPVGIKDNISTKGIITTSA